LKPPDVDSDEVTPPEKVAVNESGILMITTPEPPPPEFALLCDPPPPPPRFAVPLVPFTPD
jgi:hypothetical protein